METTMSEQTTDLMTTAVGLVTALIRRNLISDPSKVTATIHSIGAALKANPATAIPTAGFILQMIEKSDISDPERVSGYIDQISQAVSLIGAPSATSPAAA